MPIGHAQRWTTMTAEKFTWLAGPIREARSEATYPVEDELFIVVCPFNANVVHACWVWSIAPVILDFNPCAGGIRSSNIFSATEALRCAFRNGKKTSHQPLPQRASARQAMIER